MRSRPCCIAPISYARVPYALATGSLELPLVERTAGDHTGPDRSQSRESDAGLDARAGNAPRRGEERLLQRAVGGGSRAPTRWMVGCPRQRPWFEFRSRRCAGQTRPQPPRGRALERSLVASDSPDASRPEIRTKGLRAAPSSDWARRVALVLVTVRSVCRAGAAGRGGERVSSPGVCAASRSPPLWASAACQL